MPLSSLVGLAAACCILLAIALGIVWQLALYLGFGIEDRITILFGGSKKSMATDVAMAQILFSASCQTHPVTFKARQFTCYDSPIASVQSCGGDFEATIDRTQWGMDYLVDSGMPRNVYITATIEAHRQ